MESKVRLSLALLALASCGDTNIFVGAPSTVVNQTTGGPSASPSPGSDGVVTVTIAEFGESCPFGGSPAETLPRQVRVGCISDVTCNPRDAQGQVIFNLIITGPAPTSFTQVSGESFGKFTQDDDNAFNATVRGLSPGTVRLQCTVKGVPSLPWDMQVVP